MDSIEFKFFSKNELYISGVTNLPLKFLIKCIVIKILRKLCNIKQNRFIWTVGSVSDAFGPNENVRNYLERKTIRSILKEITKNFKITSACEIGCGYGRLTMVLSEFAEKVVGFEREPHLVEIAKNLLPEIDFIKIDFIDKISELYNNTFDFALTCTVLQHLPDELCKRTLDEIKKMVPSGYVLLIEKTEDISTTKESLDETKFISRARSVEVYKEWMLPFELIDIRPRIIEPVYFNKSPGTCMLFKNSN